MSKPSVPPVSISPVSIVLSGTSPATKNEDNHRLETEISGETPGRVLVVDDTAANIRLLAAILKIEGFDVLTANGGLEALKILQEETLDVVLLDIMMPEMNGFEVCAQIRANPSTANLPVVMVTALQETADRVRALEAGADDFLTKPVDEVEVVARIRSLVRAKRERGALEKAYVDIKKAESLRDSLLEMLVHDLRTPLTTILASLDLLQTGKTGMLDPLQQEVADMCMRGGRLLLSLVNELLDIGKLESGEMVLHREEIDVADLVQDAINHVASQGQKAGIRIKTEFAPELPTLWADEDLLRRVFINLLGNAVKFTGRGTDIHIRAMCQDESGAKALRFEVCDEGEGISPANQARIFHKFGQVENRLSGRRNSTGLGLTFCKLAVEAHAGRIWVESQEGQGSTFLFSIPLRDRPQKMESPTPNNLGN
ncbi:His Kinase A (phospho-acceptor) domain-containing protein [Abditibacterium utsteinense]|uniref:histidine kinase n=1 Tax=Abditibacterium utsteinense TaxID=1960156 RepID=A0A2S8SSH0_9BACT|nr:hybrid sensor histidine kinase/response regulator [Abditibacterium utsteinense]PQV63762.1 His Kinase A (phospho-acceptor) domain-containing protein [Abditibacterium utsteinense]